MTNRRRLSEFAGIVSSGGGIEGQVMSAIESIDSGGTLIIDASSFDASGTVSREYAVFSPIFINKSILIEGDSPDVRIVNKAANNDPIFSISSQSQNYFFGLKNLTLVSGSQAIAVSSSFNNINLSKIENINFYYQTSSSIKIESPSIDCKIENILIQGQPQYGIYLSSYQNHDSFTLANSMIAGATNSAVYWNKPDLGSGSNNIREVELINNAQGICVNNVRYYETNVEYINNQSDYVLSGSSVRLTGSSGGGGGPGVTAHNQLTGLSADDHKIYLHVSGTRGMSANLSMGGNSITNVNLVDGVDVGVLDGLVSSHIGNLSNPHQTSIENIGTGTLAQLNAAISDADLNSLAQFNSLTASYQTTSGTLLSTTGSLQTLSATFQSFSAAVQASTGSLQTVSGTLLNASASFATVSASFSGVSSSFVAFQTSYLNSSASFATTSASFSSLSSTYGPLSSSFTATSASFIGFSGAHASRHLSGGADPINVQYMQASGVVGNMIFMTSGTANGSIVTISSATFALQTDFIAFTASTLLYSASFATVSASFSPLSTSYAAISASYNTTSASYIAVSASFTRISASFIGFSGSHASRHLSGGSDPIDAQSLRADSIAINQLLISNGLGGWTTVASQSVGAPAGAPGAHASTHLSGGTDPINVQYMQASGVAGNMIFMTSGTANASIVTISSATFALQTDFIAATASLQAATGTLFAASASFATVSASFSPLSNSFAAISSSFINSSASFATVSASFSPLSNSFATISATVIHSSASFATTSASFSPLSNSYAAVSASFNTVSASFIGFSGAHASRHLSGAVDPINVQYMQASGVGGNMIFMTSGTANASIVTISSATFALQTDFIAFTASTLLYSASFATVSASFSPLSNSFSAISATFKGSSASFATVSASFSPLSNSFTVVSASYFAVSASYNTLSASYYAVSASYNTTSASFINSSASFATVSASFSPLSNSFAAISATFKAFSASHGSNHNSGGIDPIDVQNLRGNAVSINQLLISNGLGGWTTVASQSVGTPPGAPGAHASSHLSGGSDPIDAQLLRANGLSANQLLISNAAGGWTTVASQSVGGGGGGITTVLSSTSENYSLISGVVGSTLYLKNLVAFTAGVENPGGYAGIDYPPVIFSASDTTIYLKRTPLRNIFYDRDDFTAGSPSGTLGFSCVTAAGGKITTASVDPAGPLANSRGSAIGVDLLSIGTATTTQGAVTTLALGSTSFNLAFMTASELNFRLFPSGATAANSQRRLQFGWINNLLSSTTHLLNDQANGLYFEMSATNGNWRIAAASSSVRTIYTTSTPINSASFTNFSIIVTGSLAPTASFYINDSLVGVISSTMPTRLQPVTVGMKQVRLTGTLTPCDTYIDFVELMYEINR